MHVAELSILLIMVTEVEVVIVVVVSVITVTESAVVMMVVPSAFYRTVDPSALVIKRPSSVISELIATISEKLAMVVLILVTIDPAASAPVTGIFASKSSNIAAANSAAASGLFAVATLALSAATAAYSSSVPQVRGSAASGVYLNSLHLSKFFLRISFMGPAHSEVGKSAQI